MSHGSAAPRRRLWPLGPTRGQRAQRAQARGSLGLILIAMGVLLAACAQTGPQAGEPTATETPEEATDAEAEDPEEEPQDEPAANEPDEPLTVYSGRAEELVGPLFERLTEATGIEVEVRYGDTAELAATILEEGDRSPADLYFAQDAGALGALAGEGRLTTLPEELLEPVDPRFRATDGAWVGVSGRARTLVYSTETLAREDVPDSVLDLTDEHWRGRVGWAPTNGSFQAFVTAMRVELGDDATREWLEGMIANDVRVYESNTPIVEAAGRGEIDIGLVNHYYLYRFLEEDPEFAADNAFLEGGDVGALVNVAGAAVLDTADQPQAAEAVVEFLLSEEAQRYFAEETFEYPLVTGIQADDRLPPIESIETPDLDLSDLEDLRGTLELLRQTGALT